MQPFRFVQASRVQLDSPVIIPGECTPAERQLAEDATILAFRSLVDDCIEHEVDLLLLTGDTFGASLVTLREQMELEQGLNRLSENDVDVVIVPGPEDPAAAWREHMRLPDGTVVVDERQTDPVQIHRNGHVVAEVVPIALVDAAGRPHGCPLPPANTHVFRIGLVGTGGVDAEYLQEMGDSSNGVIHLQLDTRRSNSAEQAVFDAVNHRAVNFLAIGVEGIRQTRSTGSVTLHNPGPLQSLDSASTGSCGASLVSIDHEGRPHLELLPAARIRWEHMFLGNTDADSIEDLAIELEQGLAKLTAAEHEELWIVRWELSATTRLRQQLQRNSLNQLWELIEGTSSSRPACHHMLQISEVASGEATSHHDHGSDDFDGSLRADLDQLIHRVSHADWSGTTWGRRIVREVGKLSPSHLVPRVRETVESALQQSGERD